MPQSLQEQVAHNQERLHCAVLSIWAVSYTHLDVYKRQALNSAEQAMASVMSTVLSRLNAFLDSELEQVLSLIHI